MKKLARHVLAVACLENLEVTAAELVKIMYFTIREYLEQTVNYENDIFINLIYDDPFITGIYGALLPNIERQYKNYGNMVIADNGNYDKRLERLDQSIKKFLRIDFFEMVEVSRLSKFWQEHKKEIILNGATYKYTLKNIVE